MSKPKYSSFEDYLQEKHMKDNPEILDDNLPDAFSDWIADLNLDDWLRLGDNYGKAITVAMMKKLEGLEDVINNLQTKLPSSQDETIGDIIGYRESKNLSNAIREHLTGEKK